MGYAVTGASMGNCIYIEILDDLRLNFLYASAFFQRVNSYLKVSCNLETWAYGLLGTWIF